jgi:hypothetical protein
LAPSIKTDRLPVKNRAGEVVCYVSDKVALRWIEEKRCTPIGTKNVIRGLLLGTDIDHSKVISIRDYMGQAYSHRHDAKDNPEGVWTLKRLPKSTAPIFRAVLDSCMSKAA